MNIVVISDNYPSSQIPNQGAFVYNLLQELSCYHSITIIAPFKIHDLFIAKSKGGYGLEKCRVLRPLYFSFGKRKLFGLNVRNWGTASRNKAVERILNRLSVKPDLIYAHFLYNGRSALPYIIKHNIPLVIASGESSYSELLKVMNNQIKNLRNYTSHFICVSEKNKTGLMEAGFNESKMTIIPNAVDYSLFKPLDKKQCKEKFGISQDKFVVGFVGHFIHRKGPNRIIEAIQQLADPDIQLICVGGKGNLTSNDFTKVIPPLANYQLPEIYNSFDIFVLPTLNEGHCNVIEEAKACCLPIISSLGTSVEKQIDNSIGILINPLDINAIATSIKYLKENQSAREIMINNLKTKIGEQSLKNRAKRINELLNEIVVKKNK